MTNLIYSYIKGRVHVVTNLIYSYVRGRVRAMSSAVPDSVEDDQLQPSRRMEESFTIHLGALISRVILSLCCILEFFLEKYTII